MCCQEELAAPPSTTAPITTVQSNDRSIITIRSFSILISILLACIVGSEQDIYNIQQRFFGDIKDISCQQDTSLQRDECDPKDVVLADHRQWRGEVGYWLGELSLYQSDGSPNESADWPYPYSSYKGFITGNVEGNAYRQRNVFMYPPNTEKDCRKRQSRNQSTIVGQGTCGINGNSLVFSADQNATTCNDNASLEGLYWGFIPTTTRLVGDNALLYQVFYPLPDGNASLIQSQLTTFTGSSLRTRTAQSFNQVGEATSASFYRERKVSKDDFFMELNNTITSFNILPSDLCYMDGFTKRKLDGLSTPGYEQCINHLQQSFEPLL